MNHRKKISCFFLFYLLMMTDYLHFCLFENDNKFRKTSAYIKMVAMKWKTWQYRDWSGYLVDFFLFFLQFKSSHLSSHNQFVFFLFCFQLSCLSEFTCVNRNFFLFIYRQNEKRKKIRSSRNYIWIGIIIILVTSVIHTHTHTHA